VAASAARTFGAVAGAVVGWFYFAAAAVAQALVAPTPVRPVRWSLRLQRGLSPADHDGDAYRVVGSPVGWRVRRDETAARACDIDGRRFVFLWRPARTMATGDVVGVEPGRA
jgi:hypothetical protein